MKSECDANRDKERGREIFKGVQEGCRSVIEEELRDLLVIADAVLYPLFLTSSNGLCLKGLPHTYTLGRQGKGDELKVKTIIKCSWRGYISQFVCVTVCLCVCPALHVNKILAERMNRFGCGFLCHSYSFFLCPHIFIFIYMVHASCLYVTDTLSSSTIKGNC